MNFELADNCFQVAVLLCTALAAIAASLRYKDHRLLILALFDACISMGTLYWVLCIYIMGDIPRVFYVSEFAWLAAYLFLLSFQLERTGQVELVFSLPSLSCALLAATIVLTFRIFGPSFFVSAAFAGIVFAIVYLTVWRLRQKIGGTLIDCWLLLCVGLQLLLYVVSGYMQDFTHFNLYFAIDITLTLSFTALLPLALREVAEK